MKGSPQPQWRSSHWFDRHRLAIDVTLAVVLFLFSIVSMTAIGWYGTSFPDPYPTDPEAVGQTGLSPLLLGFFTFALIAPLAVRRTYPTLSAALCYSAALAHLFTGVSLILPADFVVLIALYSVTAYGSRRGYLIAAGGAIVGSITVAYLLTSLPPTSTTFTVVTTLVILLCFFAAWSMGMMRRTRRTQLEALAWRAERLERERDEQVALATAAERTRIAREMHDIVAHSLSVLIAQADGGRYAAAKEPEAPTRALETIGEVGRAALSDMRRLLGVLRSDAPDDANVSAVASPAEVASSAHLSADRPSTSSATLTPQPDIATLPDLVDQVRKAGLRVSYGSTGSPRPLPPGIGLVIYRVCQEALTNVLKHAGPTPQVSVMVKWEADSISAEVLDDGRGAAADHDGLGQGIIGMTERAAMFNGTLRAGPRAGGGYQVSCTIPLPG